VSLWGVHTQRYHIPVGGLENQSISKEELCSRENCLRQEWYNGTGFPDRQGFTETNFRNGPDIPS